MDRSILQSGGSPFRPKSQSFGSVTPRSGISTARRRSLLHGQGRKNQSSLNVSALSNNSPQVIFKTVHHAVERFGLSLPVLVTEALQRAERSVAVSVRLCASGWAWFVCGRRLLIWQYLQDGQRRIVNSQCRELTLPPSDLAHRAELVCVFTPRGKQVPSCIAVSPEGTVRFWPSVAHEGTSVEGSADLQGQVCDSLTDISPIGCILATTTTTIVLVQPVLSGGRHTISCRSLKPPQGWLGGIGRRMSSLLFGSMQITEAKLVKVVAMNKHGVGFDDDEWHLFILAGQTLQKWVLTDGEYERLVYECDINRMVHEAFDVHLGHYNIGSTGDQDMFLLDMQPARKGIMVLAAGTSSHMSPQKYYALGLLNTDDNVAPVKFVNFCVLKNVAGYLDDRSDNLEFQFLLVDNTALLYNKEFVVAVQHSSVSEEHEKIEFVSTGDCILGAGMCGNVPVFFSKKHGLVSVSMEGGNVEFLNSSLNMSEGPTLDHVSMSESLNMCVSVADLEELSVHKDSSARLKAAFLHYCCKNLSQAEALVNELFPVEEEHVIDIDASLDKVVVKVSHEIVNDSPAGDPRWAEIDTQGFTTTVGAPTSLQILHQLQDKQKAHELYVTFLKNIGLWNRFSAVTFDGIVKATSLVLGEHAEKIVAAISLRMLQVKLVGPVDTAIKHVLTERNIQLVGALTYQDFFYRDVSRVHEIIQVLSKKCEDLIHGDTQPQNLAKVIAEANTIILAVLQDVIQYRQQKASIFSSTVPSSSSITLCEYLPWTSAPGKCGLRDALTLQHSVTLNNGARSVGDLLLRNQLYDQLVNIIDIILDGRKSHLESISGTEKHETYFHQYEVDRYALISPFIEDEEFERAAVLAEKYCDFQILVQICELTENRERLNHYMEKFANQDFSKFVFGWYIREQKQGRLLNQFRGAEDAQKQHALGEFLESHPSLSWLQNVLLRNYSQASNTLKQLAENESELLRRKKTMLSLSKLALLASDEPMESKKNKMEVLNTEIDLTRYQEDLPEPVLTAFSYDVEKQKVLSPQELIRLYASDENRDANELDFKKALDLLSYVNDDLEKEELKHFIWCQAVLRDTWADIDMDNPLEVCQKTLFFKLIDLIMLMGDPVHEIVIPLEKLLDSDELVSLTNNSSFKYLVKVGYEQMQKIPS